MTDYLFLPPPVVSVAIEGEDARYAIRRIFCVGQNYAAHAIEMGSEVDRESPIYFTKSPHSAVASGATVDYASGTSDLHHEVELSLVLGSEVFQAPDAVLGEAAILGYGVALDMTRRDLQAAARKRGKPWDLAKDFEDSAVLAPIRRAADFGDIASKAIWLEVNGAVRQKAQLGDMIHGVGAIVADLSRYYHLGPGDMILTGTPAGVGAVLPGDVLRGGIDGLPEVALTLREADQR